MLLDHPVDMTMQAARSGVLSGLPQKSGADAMACRRDPASRPRDHISRQKTFVGVRIIGFRFDNGWDVGRHPCETFVLVTMPKGRRTAGADDRAI
jgi:hypothetical protein